VPVRRGFVAVLPWLLCAVTLILLACTAWLRWRFPDPEEGWLEATISAVGFAGIAVVGALIVSRLPHNVYGWLWCAAGAIYAVTDGVGPFLRLLYGPSWVQWVVGGAGFLSLLSLLFFVFLLFPTGRLPSPGWRWLARAAFVMPIVLFLAVLLIPDPDHPGTAAPWAVQGAAARALSRFAEAGLFLMFLLVVVGIVSTVLRFRRAGSVERRQLTWFMYAAVVNGVILVLDTVGLLPINLLFAVVSAAGFLLIPAAVAIAMLRYRLYEIDRIVSRTVTYGLLTGAIFAVYLVVVTVLSQTGLPQGSSDAVVAGVTLGVAALVGTARRRLQDVVDRRFDRARYDAVRAVDAFAARLRDQVDLDEVATGLRDTVAATVNPTRAAVWLRVPSRTGG
jgi:hypothetical protein